MDTENTRTRLREIEASVANGYEAEYRKLGWSRLSQTMLRDLHFLLTAPQDNRMRLLYDAARRAGLRSAENRTFEQWCESVSDYGLDDARQALLAESECSEAAAVVADGKAGE